MIRWLFRQLEAWVRHPGQQLTRWRRMLVATARLFIFISRQLVHDRCLQQSAALAYKTILSLVPLLVVSFFLFRSVGGLRGIGDQVQAFVFRSLNVDGLVISAGTGPTSRPISLSQEINRRLETTYRSLNISAIGLVGVLFLVLAATSLLRQTDQALNQVWKTPTRRALWVRLTTYWTVITVGPILLGASFYLAGRVQSEFSQVRLFAFVERAVAFVLPIGAAWLTLYLAYRLMPNTVVLRRSAAIGALVAALMLEVAKRAFSWYVSELVPYSKTYGGLALLPIFLIWLNLLWIVFLFGAELAYSLQNVGSAGPGARRLPPSLARGPMLALNMLCHVAARFRTGGRPRSTGQLARRFGIHEIEAQEITRALTEAGFLTAVADTRERYQLARPAETIRIADVIDALEGRFEQSVAGDHGPPEATRLAELYERLREAGRAALTETTLGDLVEPSASDGDRPAPPRLERKR